MSEATETILWFGSYSTKSLAVGMILGAAGFVMVTGAVFYELGVTKAACVLSVLSGVPLAFLWLLGQYRRFTLKYTLTTRRVIVESGLLNLNIGRVALLAISDVTCRQSGLDRAFGIGTIVVNSTDISDPVLKLLGVPDVRPVTELLDKACTEERNKRTMIPA
mgnify:CR=1 FL=1